MTVNGARRWIILASLSITGFQIIFLLIAPILFYALKYPQNIDLLQIISPVFLGYLGSASHFVFARSAARSNGKPLFLEPLVKGPLLIYVAGVVAAFFSFFWSNRSGAPLGTGMSVQQLGNALAILLGILAATTGIITSYLFSVPGSDTNHPVASPGTHDD